MTNHPSKLQQLWLRVSWPFVNPKNRLYVGIAIGFIIGQIL